MNCEPVYQGKTGQHYNAEGWRVSKGGPFAKEDEWTLTYPHPSAFTLRARLSSAFKWRKRKIGLFFLYWRQARESQLAQRS